MFNLVEKYCSFRAHNKYNYPALFAVLGCGKTLLQFTLVMALAWYGLPMLLGDNDKQKSISTVAQASTYEDSSLTSGEAKQPGVAKKVEIPAVASIVIPGTENTSAEFRTVKKTASAGMYNAEFLLKQHAGLYVVQLASSTDKKSMYQKAIEYSGSNPAIVFPFKKTRSNQVMYGFSLGLYGSVEEAHKSIATYSKDAVREGVWIRQVGALQQKIKNLRYN